MFAILTERERLTELESAIDGALLRMSDAWREISAALCEIRDSRLYIRAGASSFDEYIGGKWPALSRSTAYEWMEAGEVVRNIEAAAARSGEIVEPPRAISHARELKRLPPIAQPIALQKARELASARNAPEPTVYEVRRAVAIVLE